MIAAEDLQARASDDAPVLPTKMGKDDPLRMKLTREEHSRALGVKQIIERHPELDNLSDLMYAQLALIEEDGGDDSFVERIVDRAQKLQEIRQEYDILETYQDAIRVIHKALDLYGDQFLSFSYNPETDNYAMVHDQSKIPTLTMLNTQREGTKLKVQEMYYIYHATCPDFQSIRNGYVVLTECSNVSSREQRISLSLLQEMLHVTEVYPNNIVLLKNFNGGLFSNLFYSMVKRIMPGLKSVIEVGCTTGAGPLDKLYNMPTPEIARFRLLSRLEEVLQRRYRHEAEFSLSNK